MIKRIIDNFYLRNLVACFLYISPELFQDLAQPDRANAAFISKHISGYILFFIYFVFHSRVLYEKLFARKKYLLYFIAVPITIFVWREGTSYLIWLVTKSPAEHVYQIFELKNFSWVMWVFIYWADFVYIGIALGVYLAFKYFKERAALLEMDNVRKELELKQLNEQLNPHFLFNALNNIYSHILRDTGDGKELILKLSELMRYILDSSKKKVVSLSEELKFIEHYIAFEKERQGDRCEVFYSKNIEIADFKIVPLILFNFIENAFKHGTASVHKSGIYIAINADHDSLSLVVKNPIHDGVHHSTKTGLNNVQRRLLLLYPGTNVLDIKEEKKTYTVSLKLKNLVHEAEMSYS